MDIEFALFMRDEIVVMVINLRSRSNRIGGEMARRSGRERAHAPNQSVRGFIQSDCSLIRFSTGVRAFGCNESGFSRKKRTVGGGVCVLCNLRQC